MQFPFFLRISLILLFFAGMGGSAYVFLSQEAKLVESTSSIPGVASDTVLFLLKDCEKIPIDREFMASSRYQCYIRMLRDAVEKHGLAETSQAFENYTKRQTNESETLRGACHSWGHELGEAAVENGYSAKDIFANCTSACLDGCFNGAGHAYLALHNDLDGINEFCNPGNITETQQKEIAPCFHGVGHGLVDIFGSGVIADISRCDVISNNEGKAQCAHGIFMMFNSLPLSRIDVASIPENMPSFCSQLGSVYQQYCFDFTGYLTYGKSSNSRAAFEACKRVPRDQQNECFRRTGDILYLLSEQKDNSQFIIEQCKKGDSEEQEFWCVIGAGKLLITDANISPEKSFEICGLLSEEFQSRCYQEFGEHLESHRSKEDRVRLCGLLGKPFVDICLGFPSS